MNCCFETTIDCCEKLTTTAKEFIAAMEELSGMTHGGLIKNKRCRKIIENREASK